MVGPIGNNKLLLIEPPFYRLFKDTYALLRYPLSLGYLAGALRKCTDWEVKVYNSDFRLPAEPFQVNYLTGPGFQEYQDRLQDVHSGIWEEIRSVIIDCSPAVVGLTIKAATFASACKTAEIVKEINPETIIIAGGPLVTTAPQLALNCSNIDIGVLGEGEQTIVELSSVLNKPAELTAVKGIIFREGKEIVTTPPREPVRNPDDLASPHRFAPQVLMDYDQYPPSALGRVLATRGCPYNCFFCGSRAVWGRQVRFRSPENVTDELLELKKKGLDTVHFEDDTFGVNSSYLQNLTGMMATRVPGLGFGCETHVQLITDENLNYMKDAGCHTIQIGIESGNDRILKTMRKGFSIQQALKACELIKRHGFRLETFFMAGFPQETESSLKDTLTAIENSPADKVIFSIFTPYPGTEAFDLCLSLGLVDLDYDSSLYHHQSPLNCFCTELNLERFRALITGIEQVVVEKNKRQSGNASI